MSNLEEKCAEMPKSKTAVIAVILKDNRILLGLREYEPEKGGASVWTAPGGSVDADETLKEALQREALEETAINDLTFVDYIGEVSADQRDRVEIFYCRTEQEPQLAEPEKFREWIWYPLEKFAAGDLENYINEPAREIIVDYLTENDIL